VKSNLHEGNTLQTWRKRGSHSNPSRILLRENEHEQGIGFAK